MAAPPANRSGVSEANIPCGTAFRVWQKTRQRAARVPITAWVMLVLFTVAATLMGLHFLTDLLIGVSYVVISWMLARFWYRSKEAIPLSWIVLGFGVFMADNRHFSITLAVPEIETGLRMAVMKPEVFDAVCAGTAKFPPPAGFPLERGTCCGYTFQLYAQDKTWSDGVTGGLHHAWSLPWAVEVCNDLNSDANIPQCRQ